MQRGYKAKGARLKIDSTQGTRRKICNTTQAMVSIVTGQQEAVHTQTKISGAHIFLNAPIGKC